VEAVEFCDWRFPDLCFVSRLAFQDGLAVVRSLCW
jgi:hypothetical protein